MPIVILILIILFVCSYLVLSINRKAFLDKGTILYSIPLFVIALITYITGYRSLNIGFSFDAFSQCVVAATKIFTFELKTDVAGALYQNNTLFAVCLNIIMVLGGITLISSILGFFKIKLFNYIKARINIYRGNDLVIGYTELGLGYAKRNPGSVLVVDPTIYKLSGEEKKLLYTTGIPYISMELSSKKFNSFRNKNGLINILYFDDSRHYNKVFALMDNVEPAKNTKLVFRILCEPQVAEFVGETINYHCLKKENVGGYPLDKYEIIARKFAIDFNISGLLPRDFIEGGIIKNGKQINVHILGFGNMGKAILKSAIFSNQFITKEGGKFKVLPVNYYLYDCNEKNFKNPLIILDKNFDSIMDVKTISKPEKTFNINPIPFDIREDFLKLYSCGEENSFDLIVVCLDSSLRNASIAKDLSNKLKDKNAVVLYNVDYNSEAIESTPKLKPFGFKNDFLKHDTIVNDRLGLLASLTNESYLKQLGVGSPEEFDKLPLIKKLSNIYFQISIKGKLNLLGLTYTNDKTATPLGKEEFDKIFPTIKNPEYKTYKEDKLQNVLARLEHERWNTFHILHGYTPLELTDYSLSRGGKVHQDLDNRKHGCITTYDDLDKVNKNILKIYQENNMQKTLEEVDLYKYDFELIADIYNNLTSIGYKIIEK